MKGCITIATHFGIFYHFCVHFARTEAVKKIENNDQINGRKFYNSDIKN